MQPIMNDNTITMKLNSRERTVLRAAADICKGISLVNNGSAKTTSAALLAFAALEEIAPDKSEDDLAAADAAKTVGEQSPSQET